MSDVPENRSAGRNLLLDHHLLLELHARLGAADGLDAQLAGLIEMICQSLAAERATLFLDDPSRGELFARVATGGVLRELRVLHSEGLAGEVFTSGQGAIVPDAYADPRFEPRFDQLTGYRTRGMVCAPLRTVDGTIIGVAQALNKRDGDFVPADLALLEALCSQASLVLRSSLLVETAARAGEQEARFVRLVSELSSEIQLGPLLQRIMAAVTRMLDADRSTLFLNDEKTGELFTEIGQGLGAQKIRFANDRGIAGASFTSGASINIPYAYADLRFNPAFDRQTGYFTRSLLCVPVVNKQAKVIGVTQVLNKRGGSFTDEDEARLRAFTAQIAIGLENAKLFDDVQAMKRYNERVLASMSSAVLTFDGALQLVSGNAAAARILGCELEPGAAAGDIFGEANAWLIERLQRAVESAQVDDAMDAAIQMASRSVAVNLSSMPLLGGQGEAMGAMLVFDDITEGKRIRSTMARYVDASVADRLLEDDADSLGGQSGVATTLFSDVRSFTPLSEMLGPQRTVALLNDYFTRMVACIEAEGGMLDKFVGDEIMAVFGVPYAHEDDPDRAIRTAIAMMRGLAIFNAEREATGDPSLSIGIGINTGEVFSGNIGAPRRMDFTVMGDGVNLASRLEGACKQYRAAVLFSEGTRRSLRGTYRSREVDRIRVIGRREPVVIHELLEHHDDASFPGMIDALAAFRDGLSLYRDARFEPAIQAFERALREHPDDGVSALYIERCQRLMATPPAEGWDGIWDLTEK